MVRCNTSMAAMLLILRTGSLMNQLLLVVRELALTVRALRSSWEQIAHHRLSAELRCIRDAELKHNN